MEINIKEMVQKIVKDATEEELERIIGEISKPKKVFFEMGDILDTLLKFLDTNTFKTMVQCVDDSSKEATFRAGLMMVPSILCTYGHKFYLTIAKNNDDEGYEPKAVPDFEFGPDYKDWYCGYCGEHIDPEYDFYCSRCGKKIKMPEELKNESNA